MPEVSTQRARKGGAVPLRAVPPPTPEPRRSRAVLGLVVATHSLGTAWWSPDGELIAWLHVVDAPGPVLADVVERASSVTYQPTILPPDWRTGAVLVVSAESRAVEWSVEVSYASGTTTAPHVTLPRRVLVEGRALVQLALEPDTVVAGTLLRVSLTVRRKTREPVIVYGLWLESV